MSRSSGNSKKAAGQAMRDFNHRVTRPHLCEGCKEVLPPSSLRYCQDCRKTLVRMFT